MDVADKFPNFIVSKPPSYGHAALKLTRCRCMALTRIHHHKNGPLQTVS